MNELLELINIWMTGGIIVVTEILKRLVPTLRSELATGIVLLVFIGIYYAFGSDPKAVEMFVTAVTALASYGIFIKPVIIEPLLGARVRTKTK